MAFLYRGVSATASLARRPGWILRRIHHGEKSTARTFSTVLHNFQPRRSLLYVPGHDERKLAKIPSLNVDCAILDCEDGVAANRKTVARDVIRRMLGSDVIHSNPRTEIGVRINSVDSGMAEDDLAAVFGGDRTPDSIVFPKVESTSQADWLVDRLITFHKSKCSLRLIVLVESARSLLDMDAICSRFEERLMSGGYNNVFKLDAVIFGSDDFSANIGATRTSDAAELVYARQHFVVVAKAHRLQAIDMVHIDYKDLNGLNEHCIRGARMGFTGKQVIHPNQVTVVQTAFMPSPERIKWANELIGAFEEHQKSGKGAFTLHGNMIDMPSLRQAQNVIHMTKLFDNTPISINP